MKTSLQSTLSESNTTDLVLGYYCHKRDTTYIVESEYYNGDKYGDKCHGIEDLIAELTDIASDEKSTTIADEAKVRTDKIKITVEA